MDKPDKDHNLQSEALKEIQRLTLESFRSSYSNSGNREMDNRYRKGLVAGIAKEIFERLGGGECPESEDNELDRIFSEKPAPPEVQAYYDTIGAIASAIQTQWDKLEQEQEAQGVHASTPILAEISFSLSTPSLSEIERFSGSCGFSNETLKINVYSTGVAVRCASPRYDRELTSIIGPNEQLMSAVNHRLVLQNYKDQSVSEKELIAAIEGISAAVRALVEEQTGAKDIPVHFKMHTNISH